MKNTKSGSIYNHAILFLEIRPKSVRSNIPFYPQNTFISTPKSPWKALKFLYVKATSSPNNFCEGSIFKICLEKFIKILTDPEVGWTVNRTVLFRSKNGLPNGSKWFPKIPKLNYVILEVVGTTFMKNTSSNSDHINHSKNIQIRRRSSNLTGNQPTHTTEHIRPRNSP